MAEERADKQKPGGEKPEGKPEAGTPDDGPHPEGGKNWVARHRWTLGLAAAGLVGGYWWHRSRKKRIVVDRVSEDWLMQHEVESGRSAQE